MYLNVTDIKLKKYDSQVEIPSGKLLVILETLSLKQGVNLHVEDKLYK